MTWTSGMRKQASIQIKTPDQTIEASVTFYALMVDAMNREFASRQELYDPATQGGM